MSLQPFRINVKQLVGALATHFYRRGGGEHGLYAFHPLTTPLTSSSWDGDSYSTTAKTSIDLSSVFGVPASATAVLCQVSIQDSGSAGTRCYVILSPNNTAGQGPATECSGLPNDTWTQETLVCPCDSSGDVYYQILASGASTMEVYFKIWGYWL